MQFRILAVSQILYSLWFLKYDYKLLHLPKIYQNLINKSSAMCKKLYQICAFSTFTCN